MACCRCVLQFPPFPSYLRGRAIPGKSDDVDALLGTREPNVVVSNAISRLARFLVMSTRAALDRQNRVIEMRTNAAVDVRRQADIA